MQNWNDVDACAEVLGTKLGQIGEIALGVVLGTGLGDFTARLSEVREVMYTELPNFPPSLSESHKGSFVFGRLGDVPILVQNGRCHLYEGRSPAEVCMGIRVMHGLGVRGLVLTNASGALNPLFAAGSLMCVTDQINMTGLSPLTGPNHDGRGIRFPDLSRTFDREFLECARRKALELSIPLERGVYIGVHGPELETPAETRLYRMLGADAIGMSSVLEVIAARHLGLRVLEISCLANVNLPDCMKEVRLGEVIAQSARACDQLTRLLLAVLPEMAESLS